MKNKLKIFITTLVFISSTNFYTYADNFDTAINLAKVKRLMAFVEKELLLKEMIDLYITEQLDFSNIQNFNNLDKQNILINTFNIKSDFLLNYSNDNNITFNIIIHEKGTGIDRDLTIKNSIDSNNTITYFIPEVSNFAYNPANQYTINYNINNTFTNNEKDPTVLNFYKNNTLYSRKICNSVSFDSNNFSKVICPASETVQYFLKIFLENLNSKDKIFDTIMPIDNKATWLKPNNNGDVETYRFNITSQEWIKNDEINKKNYFFYKDINDTKLISDDNLTKYDIGTVKYK